MGLYINPEDQPKEAWFLTHATTTCVTPQRHIELRGGEPYIALCLIDNGAFTALGVAYSPGELEAFAELDGRPKLWGMARVSDVEAVLEQERTRWLR